MSLQAPVLRTVALSLLCCVLLAGCGATPTATTAPGRGGGIAPTAAITAGGPQGYLLSGKLPKANHGVWFLQWTEANGTLTGQSQIVATSDSASPSPSSESSGFTGTRNGSNISMQFGGFGGSLTVSGTINGETLTILYPDSRSGQFEQFTFKRATTQDYNSAAQAFRQQVVAPATMTAVHKAASTATASFQNAQFGLTATIVAPTLLGTWKLVQRSSGNAFASDTLVFDPNESGRASKTQGDRHSSSMSYRITGPDTMLIAFGGGQFQPDLEWGFSLANGTLTLTHPQGGGTSTWKRAP